eukprot:6194825-Pleurochrysis_carterae.AAC.1
MNEPASARCRAASYCASSGAVEVAADAAAADAAAGAASVEEVAALEEEAHRSPSLPMAPSLKPTAARECSSLHMAPQGMAGHPLIYNLFSGTTSCNMPSVIESEVQYAVCHALRASQLARYVGVSTRSTSTQRDLYRGILSTLTTSPEAASPRHWGTCRRLGSPASSLRH